MCYSNPTKSLELAKEHMTPGEWASFEADFEHFCSYSGFPVAMRQDIVGSTAYAWAKWAFLKGGA
jgi:hypothetical protein